MTVNKLKNTAEHCVTCPCVYTALAEVAVSTAESSLLSVQSSVVA
jgi:hypothetical protein